MVMTMTMAMMTMAMMTMAMTESIRFQKRYWDGSYDEQQYVEQEDDDKLVVESSIPSSDLLLFGGLMDWL